jgi:GTPase KRas protein
VVYSIAARSTFDRVEKIVERVMLVKDEASMSAGDNVYGRPSPRQRMRTPIVIVGNKRDQGNDREVSPEEGRALATQLGFFETSARLNQNVEAAFKQLVRSIKIAKRGPEAAAPTAAPSQPKKKHRKCIIL